MRLPILVAAPLLSLALAALAPGGAHAATIAREGTEIVYRSAPGEVDDFVLQANPDERPATKLFVEGRNARAQPGPGCARGRLYVECSLDGITAVRALAGDGDDDVAILLDLPVIVDLGPGADDFVGRASILALAGGDGRDEIEASARAGTVDAGPGADALDLFVQDPSAGPLAIEGGDGDDRITVAGSAEPGVAVSGGAGDDTIDIAVYGSGPGIDVACGPGDDVARLRLSDRPGDGCAAHVTVGSPQSVSRSFREGDVTGPASVAVTFRRRPGGDRRAAEALARGTTTVTAAGPLRVRLKTTRAGRRWTRREANLKLFVSIRTRTSGDRNDYAFDARLEGETPARARLR